MDENIQFWLFFISMLVSIVAISLLILIVPNRIRARNMKAFAEEFALQYTAGTPGASGTQFTSYLVFSKNTDTAKKHIITGTLKGHTIEIFDQHHVQSIIIPFPFTTYSSGTKRHTSCFIDGEKIKLPRRFLFTNTTPTKILRRYLHSL